jgi:hypothetical protein
MVELLQTHPYIEFLNYVFNDIRDGFDTMITNADLLTICANEWADLTQPLRLLCLLHTSFQAWTMRVLPLLSVR